MSADTGSRGHVATPGEPLSGLERMVLSRAFARLDVVALGAAVGSVAGLGLFLATVVLLVRGGSLVGLHLSRLRFFLPGYEVTWLGSVIGLVEGAIAGFALGALVATLWNLYHRFFVGYVMARERRREIRRELQEL